MPVRLLMKFPRGSVGRTNLHKHAPARLRALSSTEIQVEMRAPLLFNSGKESALRCELWCFSVSLDLFQLGHQFVTGGTLRVDPNEPFLIFRSWSHYKPPYKQRKLQIKRPISLKLSTY
jgi:hypothetical protein